MTDYLKEAQMFANYLDGDGPPDRYERNAHRATALALIAIAQELRVMNAHNTGAMELEREDEDEDLGAYCIKCGFLKLAHGVDRCPTEEEADTFVLGELPF